MTDHPAPKGAQRRMFEQVATGTASPIGFAKKTHDALLSKGLIRRAEDRIVGAPPFQFRIVQYEVPIPVHMQWCEWCAENVEDTDQ